MLEFLIGVAWFIIHMSRMIQLIYKVKRRIKLHLKSMCVTSTPQSVVRKAVAHEMVLSYKDLVAEMRRFARHIGIEHVTEDRFSRYLYWKYKPPVRCSGRGRGSNPDQQQTRSLRSP